MVRLRSLPILHHFDKLIPRLLIDIRISQPSLNTLTGPVVGGVEKVVMPSSGQSVITRIMTRQSSQLLVTVHVNISSPEDPGLGRDGRRLTVSGVKIGSIWDSM